MVEDQTHIDAETPTLSSKFFHNKISVGIYQLTLALEKTLDPRTLFAFLGPAGLILVVFSVSQFSKKFVKLNLTLILFATLLVVFTKFSFSILILAALWQLLALQGIKFLKNPTWGKIVVLLLLLTLWYFSLDWKMPQICNDIKFN